MSTNISQVTADDIADLPKRIKDLKDSYLRNRHVSKKERREMRKIINGLVKKFITIMKYKAINYI